MTTRTPRRRQAAALLTAACLTLTGCGIGPQPPPSSETKIPSPSIPSPLNSAKVTADPCTALRVDQLTYLGFAPATSVPERVGACYLETGKTSGVRIYFNTAYRESLAMLYGRHAQGLDTGNHWEELTISGYPAVVVEVEENTPDHRDKGPLSCTLALGVDDTLMVSIRTNTYENASAGPWRYDPCGATKKIAELVVDNLRN